MSNSAKIEIDIDCGNCPMQNDEKLWIEITIGDLLRERSMKINKMEISK